MGARRLGPGDIEAILTALRPRLADFITTSGPSSSGKIPPHTHHAEDIGVEPAGENWIGYIDENVLQDVLQEIDDEKLARSGVQPMRGSLDMDDGNGPFNIFDINNLTLTGAAGQALISGVRNLDMTVALATEGNITGVRDIDMSNAIVGEGVIQSPRVIHMAGDLGDGEALIDALDKVNFNATPTQAIIENLGRTHWQTEVEPGVDYTTNEGIESWSSIERDLVAHVRGDGSPTAYVPIALGWTVRIARDYTPE